MAKTKLQSTRTSKKIFISKTGVEVIEKQCRKCREVKPPRQFYIATDYYIDTDGIQSVCKSCFNDIYDAAYIRERTVNRAIIDCCRALNLRYHEPAVQSVLEQIKKSEDADKKPRPPLSIYIQRMVVMCSRGDVIEEPSNHELTFFEPSSPLVTEEDEALMSHDQFWGEKFSTEHVEFLEEEYGRLRAGSPPENYAETVLIKQVCYKLLEIKKSRDSDSKKIGTLEKELLNLMKDLAISPAHANAASGGKSIDTYGIWIKQVEELTPAEWLESEGKPLFYDIDNIEKYFQEYFVRPLRNFISGSADYNILNEDEGDGDVEELSIEQ